MPTPQSRRVDGTLGPRTARDRTLVMEIACMLQNTRRSRRRRVHTRNLWPARDSSAGLDSSQHTWLALDNLRTRSRIMSGRRRRRLRAPRRSVGRDKTSQRVRCTSRLDVFFSFRRARDALTQAQQHAHHNARQFAEDVAHGVAWHQASSDNGAPGGVAWWLG